MGASKKKAAYESFSGKIRRAESSYNLSQRNHSNKSKADKYSRQRLRYSGVRETDNNNVSYENVSNVSIQEVESTIYQTVASGSNLTLIKNKSEIKIRSSREKSHSKKSSIHSMPWNSY